MIPMNVTVDCRTREDLSALERLSARQDVTWRFGPRDQATEATLTLTDRAEEVPGLLENPKAEICAFRQGKWLRLAGELALDARFEARKSMLDAYPSLRNMYDENDGNTAVFYFTKGTATFSSFTEEPRVIEL